MDCLFLADQYHAFIFSRARVHWIGCRRYRRPERVLMVLLFLGAMFLLEPREYVLWSLASGSGVSLFLILVTIYRFIPHKRAHWI